MTWRSQALSWEGIRILWLIPELAWPEAVSAQLLEMGVLQQSFLWSVFGAFFIQCLGNGI